MSRAYLLILLVAFSGVGVSTLEAQWKTYTSKRNVVDIAVDSTTLWAATAGGAFSYKISSGTYHEIATAEGLRTIDLTAVVVDGRGDVWFGAANGYIHRYTPSTGGWQYVTDIFQIQNPQKRINSFRVYGDSLFILSDFGVSILSISKLQFADTYSHFGPDTNQIAGTVVDFTFYHGAMWVATRFGIAVTSVGNANPSVPQSWQVFNHLQGLPSDNVTALAILNDTLYASTSAGVVRFNGLTWQIVVPTAGWNIVDMTVHTAGNCSWCGNLSPPFLNLITVDHFYALHPSDNLIDTISGFPSPLTRLARDGEWVMGTATKGIMIGVQPISFIAPPGPPSNSFIGIAVDNRGVLWSGTGAAFGTGFMSYDGITWKSYSVASDPRLSTDNYYKVSIGANNCKWISNFGSGIALLDDRGTLRNVLNASNGLPPAVDPSFVAVGGVATSPDGITWLTDRTPPPDTNLVRFMPDSSLSYIVGCGPGCNMRSPVNVFTDVVIDQNGTKWFANYGRFEPNIANRAVGFFFYNEHYSLPGTANGWGSLTTDDGITSNEVWSVAVDRDNAVWIGTDQGLSIIFDPSNPHANVAIYHPLNDQVIQGIVADALNDKWIATRNGVFQLSPDGTDILNHYTVENTDGKLLNNDVASLAIDNRSGVIYFGTESGLSAFSTTAVTPDQVFGELTFSPNPYYVPAQSQLLIGGLVQGTTLKVLRIDGGLVREIPTPGGRIAYWDGKDRVGQPVPTGVYIIVAYSEDGTSVATGKVAVIRR